MYFSKRIKKLAIKVIMVVLGRSLQFASWVNPTVRREAASWPEGFTIVIKAPLTGPAMVVEKRGGRIIYRGGKYRKADLLINYNNTECAFLVFMGLLDPEQGLAQNRMSVVGDLPAAMGFIRCVNIMLVFLFPKLISRRLLKRSHRLSHGKKIICLGIMLLGIPLII